MPMLASRPRARRTVPVVVDVPDPFQARTGRRVEAAPWAACRTVAEVCARLRPNQPPHAYHVALDDRIIPVDARDRVVVPPDGHLCLVTAPRVYELIVGAVVLVISAAISAWSGYDANRRARIQGHHAARRSAAHSAMMGDSLIYGWEGIQNSVTPGRPIPVLYGRHRVGGHYAYAVPRRAANGTDYLDAILVVSKGEVSGLEAGTIEINGEPSANFSGLSTDSRNGTLTQTAISGLWPTLIPRTTNNPQNLLYQGGGVQGGVGGADTFNTVLYVSQPDRTGFQFTFALKHRPEALYDATTSGRIVASGTKCLVSFQARYRSYPSGSFGTPATEFFNSGWLAADIFRGILQNGRYDIAVFVSHRSQQFGRDRYEVELSVTAVGLYPPTGYNYLNLQIANWCRIHLREVQEFAEFQQTFPTRALLGFSALASQNLGGGLPTVTSIWLGKLVRVYTSTATMTVTSGTDGVTNAGTDQLDSAAQDFENSGVEEGDTVVITGGGDAGTYLVRRVATARRLWLRNTNGTTPSFVGTTSRPFTVTSRRGTWTVIYTANPAWVNLDILASKRDGGGTKLQYNRHFDLQSYIDAAAFCDVLIGRGTTNPIRSGTGNGTTNAGTNQFDAPGGTWATGGVRVDDTLVISSGADAGSYRIDSINVATGRLTVATVTGGTVSFAGAAGANWTVNGTERRMRCDHYFDGTTNVWAAAIAVAQNARCAIVRSSGLIKLIPDTTGNPVQVFGAGNIIAGSYRRFYAAQGPLANRVEVQYLDEDYGWTQRVVSMENPDALTNADTVQPTQVEAFGVTRATQAMRIAKYHYLANRDEGIEIEFETSVEGLGLEWGDVIRVRHPTEDGTAGRYYHASGRVRAVIDATTLQLDQHVILDGTETIAYRNTADTIENRSLDSTAGVLTDRVTMGNTTGAVAGQPFALYRATAGDDVDEEGEYKIVSITRTHDLRRKVRARAYMADLYAEADNPESTPLLDLA